MRIFPVPCKSCIMKHRVIVRKRWSHHCNMLGVGRHHTTLHYTRCLSVWWWLRNLDPTRLTVGRLEPGWPGRLGLPDTHLYNTGTLDGLRMLMSMSSLWNPTADISAWATLPTAMCLTRSPTRVTPALSNMAVEVRSEVEVRVTESGRHWSSGRTEMWGGWLGRAPGQVGPAHSNMAQPGRRPVRYFPSCQPGCIVLPASSPLLSWSTGTILTVLSRNTADSWSVRPEQVWSLHAGMWSDWHWLLEHFTHWNLTISTRWNINTPVWRLHKTLLVKTTEIRITKQMICRN